jgi:hypothetical protein
LLLEQKQQTTYESDINGSNMDAKESRNGPQWESLARAHTQLNEGKEAYEEKIERQEAELKRRTEALAMVEHEWTVKRTRADQGLAPATATVTIAETTSRSGMLLDANLGDNLATVLQGLATEMRKPKPPTPPPTPTPAANTHMSSNGQALRNLSYDLSKITNDPTNCSMMQCIARWNQRFQGERRLHEIISEREAIRAWKGMMTQRVTGAQQINEHVTNAQGTEDWTVEKYIVQ